jgi:hypothetical protein
VTLLRHEGDGKPSPMCRGSFGLRLWFLLQRVGSRPTLDFADLQAKSRMMSEKEDRADAIRQAIIKGGSFEFTSSKLSPIT